MRVLFDIVHPAHAHFYRYLHDRLIDEGHDTLVLARDKEVTLALLDSFGIPYETHGRPQQGRLSQARELAARDVHLYRMGRRFRPDFVLARNPAGMHAAKALGAVGIFDTDDGKAGGPISRLAVPLASVVTSPESLTDDYGEKHVVYPGYKSLAFLHPDHFTPDPSIRDRLGVGATPYAIVRLTAMDSAHDRNEEGVPTAVLDELVARLEVDHRVFLSTEGRVPERWRDRAFPAELAGEMHDAIAGASIIVGDSGSMVGEAAVLGTPAVFCGSFAEKRAILVDLEESWQLAEIFRPDESDAMLDAVTRIVSDPATPKVWQERRARLLDHAVDVSAWYFDLLCDIDARSVAAATVARRTT